jgi:hypothetical protein
MTCGAVPQPASRSDVGTGFCRPVPGRPSKHGANIGSERSRPLPEPLPVEVQLPATRYMSPAPGDEAETVSTVRDSCWQRLGFDRAAALPLKPRGSRRASKVP